MKRQPLPDQPFRFDKLRVLRFRENKVVSALLDESQKRGFGMNELARMGLPNEDWRQFAQLIGYSLSGYGDLSYVNNKTWDRVARKAPKVKR